MARKFKDDARVLVSQLNRTDALNRFRRDCVGHIGRVQCFSKLDPCDDVPYRIKFRGAAPRWFHHSELEHAPKPKRAKKRKK